MPHIDRRSLARFYGWLRHIKTWQLVVILVIASVVSASLLRIDPAVLVEPRGGSPAFVGVTAVEVGLSSLSITGRSSMLVTYRGVTRHEED